MDDKIFVRNVGSIDEAIMFYQDVGYSIEMQYGPKAREELGVCVRGLELEADGTINVYLHENIVTPRIRKRFEVVSQAVL